MDGATLASMGEADLKALFEALDGTQTGYLVQSDLESMVTQMQMDMGQVGFLMQLLDTDGDGKIYFEDFRAGFGKASKEQIQKLSPMPRRRATNAAPTGEPSPLPRTPSAGSQGSRESERDDGSGSQQHLRPRRVPSVTLTDSEIRQPGVGESLAETPPSAADGDAVTRTLFQLETEEQQQQQQQDNRARLASGREVIGASGSQTPVSAGRPLTEGAPAEGDEKNNSGKDGMEVEPKFTLNWKRFGRRSRPLSEAYAQYEEEDDDAFAASSSPGGARSPALTSPTRGKRQHILDTFHRSGSGGDQSEGGAMSPTDLAPKTPLGFGPQDSPRYSGRVGLHSIAEALSGHSAAGGGGVPEAKSPLMASTPTVGRKLLRMRSPLTHFVDDQEFFETAGPLSPVTELSQEDISVFVEERVRSVLEECNISPGRAIDKKDFSTVCQQLNMDIPEDKVHELFEQLDTTGEGFISLDGFVEGVSNSFTMSQVSSPGSGSMESWSRNKPSASMAPDSSIGPFNSKSMLRSTQRPNTPLQRASITNRAATPVIPFSHKQELFPVLTQLLDPEGMGTVKIDTLYKVWVEEQVDMEDDSNAVKFLEAIEMNTNSTVDVSKITARLEGALENDDGIPMGDRYLALHFVYREVHALRTQAYQATLETDKVRSNLVRIQEERDRLINEGDDHAESQSHKHAVILREEKKKFAEKLAMHERELRGQVEKIAKEEAMHRQRLEEELDELQAEERNIRNDLKEKNDLMEQQEADMMDLNTQVHSWKGQCNRLKEDLSAQRMEALQLLQRESDDKAFQELLETEIAKRMETERFALKALQDQYDELKADRDTLYMQLASALRKTSREKRPSFKRPRTHSDAARKQDKVKASPRVKRKSGGGRLHVPSAGGLATPSSKRRSLNLDLEDLSDGDHETSADTSLLSPLDISLMDELKTDLKSPADDEKLELIGRQESLQREKKDLLDSNRTLEEKCAKLNTELQQAQASLTQAEKDVAHLQGAVKAVDMQKAQLVNLREQLTGQLEETNAQLITSRKQCRDTEDRVVELTDRHDVLIAELESTQRKTASHQEARQQMASNITDLKEQLSTALQSLGQVETDFEDARREKTSLETQVAEVSAKLESTVASRAELENTLKMSDASLHGELAKQQKLYEEECASFTDTVQQLQAKLDGESAARATAEVMLRNVETEKNDLVRTNSALVEDVQSLSTQKADALKQAELAHATVVELSTAREELARQVAETAAELATVTGDLNVATEERTSLLAAKSRIEGDSSAKQCELEEGRQLVQRELAAAKVQWEETFQELNTKLEATLALQQGAEGRAAELSEQIVVLENQHVLLVQEKDSALAEVRSHESDLEATRQRLASAEEQAVSLEAKLEQHGALTARQHEESMEEWEMRRGQLENDLAEEHRRAEELTTELHLKAEDTTCFQAKLRELSQRLQLSMEENSGLQEAAESQENQWQDTYEVLGKQVDTLLQELEEARPMAAAVQDLRRRQVELANDKARAEEECEAVHAQLATSEEQAESHLADLESEQQRAEALQAELATARAEASQLQSSLLAEQAALAQYKTDLAQNAEHHGSEAGLLRLEVDKLNEDLGTRKATIGQLESSAQSLQQELQQSQAGRERLVAAQLADVEQLRAVHKKEMEELAGSTDDMCEAARREVREEWEEAHNEQMEKQATAHAAEIAQLTAAHSSSAERHQDQIAALQSTVSTLSKARKDRDAEQIIADLRSQVQTLEIQVSSEQQQSAGLQSQLRKTITDNTRMTLEMTRMQRHLQAQAEDHLEELQRVQEQVDQAQQQRAMAAITSRHQQEIGRLREEMRGSERLREVAWEEEKAVLMDIIRQLTMAIGMGSGDSQPVGLGGSHFKAPPRMGQRLAGF